MSYLYQYIFREARNKIIARLYIFLVNQVELPSNNGTHKRAEAVGLDPN